LLRITGAGPDAKTGAAPTPREERSRVKERLFVAPNCATLVDTLAVAITLAVSSLRVGMPPPTSVSCSAAT